MCGGGEVLSLPCCTPRPHDRQLSGTWGRWFCGPAAVRLHYLVFKYVVQSFVFLQSWAHVMFFHALVITSLIFKTRQTVPRRFFPTFDCVTWGESWNISSYCRWYYEEIWWEAWTRTCTVYVHEHVLYNTINMYTYMYMFLIFTFHVL